MTAPPNKSTTETQSNLLAELLAKADIDAILESRHWDPFAVLGPHLVREGAAGEKYFARCFLPGAAPSFCPPGGDKIAEGGVCVFIAFLGLARIVGAQFHALEQCHALFQHSVFRYIGVDGKLLFGGGWDWVAEVAGFATGFLLSFVVSPGGWGHVMARLRRR